MHLFVGFASKLGDINVDYTPFPYCLFTVLFVAPWNCNSHKQLKNTLFTLWGNSMREYHVTKILFLMVSSWFFNILLSTSCALKKREKFIYRLPIHVVTFSQSGRYFF